jgi:hypothetical protein
MPLQNIHPDLKLGLVLVAAAALLKFANSNVLLAFVAAQRLNIVSESFGWHLLAGGIGGLAVVGAAILVDRRPPHTLMAGGAVVAVLGLTIVGLSNSFPASALGMFVAGVGGQFPGVLRHRGKGRHAVPGHLDRGAGPGLHDVLGSGGRRRLAVRFTNAAVGSQRRFNLGRGSSPVPAAAAGVRRFV